MQIFLNNLSLSLFEFIFIAIIPAILIILGIAYIIVSKKQLKVLQNAIFSFNEKMDTLDDYSIGHLSELKLYADETEYKPLQNAVLNLIKDSKAKYDNKWLPQLSDELNEEKLTTSQLKTSLYFTPAILLFSCGFISSLVLAVMPLINAEVFKNNAILTFIPLFVGVLLALFLLNHRYVLQNKINYSVKELTSKIEQYLPVYTDKSSLALLVNEMTGHEDKINSAMTLFNTNFENFVSEDFKNNISSSVEKVMRDEIVPPINKSSEILSDLASKISEQQQEGMRELADKFSENLKTNLDNNFDSLAGKLSSFNLMMEDTTNFIQDSVAILENSRQQNILLSKEVSESIKLMTVAKNDIANEMAEMSDNLEVISNVTEKMTSVYAGEDANLKVQIGSLESALHNSLKIISESISQSQATIQLSSQLKNEQNEQYLSLTSKMDNLLEDLKKINSSIGHSTEIFAKESDAKVDKTLYSFETALASIVERLIFTTAEIKDAVENLPSAIKTSSEKRNTK